MTKFYDPVIRSVATEIVCSKLAAYLSVCSTPARTFVYLPEVLFRKQKNSNQSSKVSQQYTTKLNTYLSSSTIISPAKTLCLSA